MSDLRSEMAGAGTPPGGVERLHPGGQSACGPQVHVYGQPGEQVECRLAHTGYDAPSVAELGGGLLIVGVVLAIGVRRLSAPEAKQ